MKKNQDITSGPHQDQPVLHAGAPLKDARAAMILIHGRGADARDILSLSSEFRQSKYAYLAPQAAGNSWYPFSFLAPVARNEPGISSGLQAIADLFSYLEQEGFPPEKIIISGFSQGACMALEFVARHPRKYGGVAGLSGGLIGPPGTPGDYPGSLEGTPVFLGCSDSDFHIPKERVQETTRVLKEMDAEVTERLYPNMEHTINSDEITFLRNMMDKLL